MTTSSYLPYSAGAFPDAVRRLIERFEASKTQPAVTRFGYRSIEAQIRNDFLHTFFESLGWDMHNQRTHPREVVVEQDIPGSYEKVDYCFRFNGQPKFFVEAKRPTVNLGDDKNIEQIFEYSRKSNVPLVILTNFEDFVVYGWCTRPTRGQQAILQFVPIGRLNYRSYDRFWGHIAGVFSRAAVERGHLDDLVRQVEGSNGDFDLFALPPRTYSQPISAHAAWPPSPYPSNALLPHAQPYQAPQTSSGQLYTSSHPGTSTVGLAPVVTAGGILASKLLLPFIVGGTLVTLLFVGTCAALLTGSSESERPRGANRGMASPPQAGDRGQHQCSLGAWDGAVRGWAKLGQCGQSGVLNGYYLRVASNQDEATSRAAVAQAWATYVETYLSDGACPPAREMVFFDRNGESGAGILFTQRPPRWDTIMQSEPQWRLLGAGNQPVTTQVCFFPADESRRPAGWSR